MNALRRTPMVAVILLCAGCGYDGTVAKLLLSPDQRGELALREGAFTAAAETFRDPLRAGYAWLRAGDFEQAARVLAAAPGADASFNRGTALVFLGEYDAAIACYDDALRERPDWPSALHNRAIAVARKERMAPPEGDFGGTEGLRSANEIVVGDRPIQGGSETEEDPEQGSELSDEELRALWLQNLETSPSDFLRAKFASQLLRASAPDDAQGEGR